MNQKQYTGKQLIAGMRNGRKIRPSNWYERILEFDMDFDQRTKRFHYLGHMSAVVDPAYGISVVVDFDALKKERPDVYEEVGELIHLLGADVIPCARIESDYTITTAPNQTAA